MELQLNITIDLEQLLQKEATERNLPISKLVSDLIESYFAMRQGRKLDNNSSAPVNDSKNNGIARKESPKELLIRFAAESPKLSISEEESMDEIVAEIKAYRKEKREKQLNSQQ